MIALRIFTSRCDISFTIEVASWQIGDLPKPVRRLTNTSLPRPRMRERSRNSLKNLASIFQSPRGERIRNFIGKYLCHPWVVYYFHSCYKSTDCCRVFTCRFWLVFDVLCVNFRGCCDALWCLLKAVGDLEEVGTKRGPPTGPPFGPHLDPLYSFFLEKWKKEEREGNFSRKYGLLT